MSSAFDPRMVNSTARSQVEVHTSDLTSSLRGLSQGDKKLSVEFAFKENISLDFFSMKNKLCGLQEQSYLVSLSQIQAGRCIYAQSRRSFVFCETYHFLDQYSSSSITRIKFCHNHAIGKYLSTTYFMCLVFRQKERFSGSYISYI